MKIAPSPASHSPSQPTPGRMSRKLALAAGGTTALTGLPGVADADVVKSDTLPLTSPPGHANTNWDVDGNGMTDFVLDGRDTYAYLNDSNGGRLVAPMAATGGGIAKLSGGAVVGNTLASSFKFFSAAQTANLITYSSKIGSDAEAGGWSIGDTGFFGFKFTNGGDTHYGWGRLRITGEPAGANQAFTVEEAYYEDEPGKSIVVGDTIGDVPDTMPPEVKVKGKKRVKTSKSRVKLKGTATDAEGVTSVTYQVGKKTRTAKGTSNWKISLRVNTGRTKVKVLATDAAGNISSPAKVTVIRN